jgi:OmpA-OmpF porin, OOP family
MIKAKIIKYVVALTFLAGMGGITGCSSTPKIQEFADTANPSDEVQRFANDMQTAVQQQVDVLSPAAFRKADKHLKSAVIAREKGKDAKDILHSVAEGRAHLNRANQFAELSRTNMEDVVAARQAALTAGASKYFADELNKSDDNLRDVTSEIEDNDLGSVAKNRAKLQKEYLDVELKAIKQSNLGAARATLALAIKEGAKDFAKQSLAITEKKINDADAFIVANRHQTVTVKSRSEDAVNTANHLLKITRASKAGKNISSEETALRLEAEQNKTQNERDQLIAERSAAKDLAVETSKLKSDQAFNQSFETAQAEFTKNEAEVSRQGDQLVIRLRTLEFPVNQSVLKGSNFPLLAKVAKVVKSFENSTVAIEGHTDSNGGKALNDKLSTERAQAVSDYLVSSQAIDREKVTVAGFGFERPMASNKTAKGQAQNRRVDIIINPNAG